MYNQSWLQNSINCDCSNALIVNFEQALQEKYLLEAKTEEERAISISSAFIAEFE